MCLWFEITFIFVLPLFILIILSVYWPLEELLSWTGKDLLYRQIRFLWNSWRDDFPWHLGIESLLNSFILWWWKFIWWMEGFHSLFHFFPISSPFFLVTPIEETSLKFSPFGEYPITNLTLFFSHSHSFPSFFASVSFNYQTRRSWVLCRNSSEIFGIDTFPWILPRNEKTYF